MRSPKPRNAIIHSPKNTSVGATQGSRVVGQLLSDPHEDLDACLFEHFGKRPGLPGWRRTPSSVPWLLELSLDQGPGEGHRRDLSLVYRHRETEGAAPMGISADIHRAAMRFNYSSVSTK